MFNLSDYGFNILQIETYGLCNMECGFCPYPLKGKKEKISKLETNTIFNTLDQINSSDPDFKYVTFSQFNEPLLDSRIFDFIEYAKKKSLQVYFISNGLLLDKDKNIAKLVELNPVIKISLQMLDDSKHKMGRGLNMELEKYMKKIIYFIDKVKDTSLKVAIDVGSNFNDSKTKFFLKKLCGLSVGDPNVPYTTNETLFYLKKYFDDMMNNEHNKNLYNANYKIDANYLSQEGIKLTENISIKIKHFHYGNRIKDFYPINNNFSCKNNILGIQSTGDIVPCCLAYDGSISLGNIKKDNLEEILINNNFLNDLRTKHITCRKCFGEPTKRGAAIRNLINSFK